MARQKIPVRILLPVQEVIVGFNSTRVAVNRGPAMGRWSQTDHLRTKVDQPVVAVMSTMIKGDTNGHVV